MAAPRYVTWEQLVALAATFEPGLRSAMLTAFAQLRDHATERAIADALARGDANGVVDLIFGNGGAESAYSVYRERARAALRDAGRYVARDIPAYRPAHAPRGAVVLRVRFDELHPAVIESFQRFDRELFRTVHESAREGVHAIIRAGLETGQGPAATARQIRSLVGLGPTQARAVVNFRRYLETGDRAALARELRDRRFDRTITKLWADGKSLTPAQVDKMTAAYERRYKAFQAEISARTTSMNALREGVQLSWRQAIAEGRVRADELTRRWVTKLDGRERPSHHEMHGTTVAWDEPWIVPGVGAQRWPGETEFSCRCVEIVRRKLVINYAVPRAA